MLLLRFPPPPPPGFPRKLYGGEHLLLFFPHPSLCPAEIYGVVKAKDKGSRRLGSSGFGRLVAVGIPPRQKRGRPQPDGCDSRTKSW